MSSMSNTDYSLEAHYRKADRIMLGVLWLMLTYSLGLAAWNGTWGQALLVGGGTLACMQALALMIPASRLLRCLIGAAFMVLGSFIGYAPAMFCYSLYGYILDLNPGLTGYKIVFGIMACFALCGAFVSVMLVKRIRGGRKTLRAATE